MAHDQQPNANKDTLHVASDSLLSDFIFQPFLFRFKIYINYTQPLKKYFGEPRHVESRAFENTHQSGQMDTVYVLTYNNNTTASIYKITSNQHELLVDLKVVSQAAKMRYSLSIGDSIDDFIKLFGKPNNIIGNMYTFIPKGAGDQLSIEVRHGRIRNIIFSYYID